MSLEIATQVMESYTQIDRQIDAFQAQTQLHCPPGCGWCCENPEVETTPLEMLPLILELFRRDDLDPWLDAAEAADYKGQCVFYKSDPFVAGNGRCQVYPWRPTLCRLFGFSTVTQKSGQQQLAACVRHKESLPVIVAQAQEAIAQGTVEAPSMPEEAQKIYNLDPVLAQQRMPINAALRVAIDKVGLWMQMSASCPESGGKD